MRYEDMPKGRNKDRCVRCGKRYNFADKALSKAKVPYDLLCLAEVTTSGYMTHGNVKLCDECMVELLMWLDRKTENNSEKPNNCEHITEDGVTCAKYPACDDCLDNPLNKVKGSERLVKGSEQTKSTISKMEQVDEPITQTKTQNSNLTFEKTERKCIDCNFLTYMFGKTWCNIKCENPHDKVCDRFKPKDEPQTDCAWK